MSKRYVLWTACLCVCSTAIGYTAVRRHFDNANGIVEQKLIEDESIENTPEEKEAEKQQEEEPQSSMTEEAKTVSSEQRINPSTKIVYQYYYPEREVTEEQVDSPPYFLLDMTLSDMVKYYDNWTIVSFSDKEVVMKKTIYEKDEQRYIIGEKDGYIAVYYEKEVNGSDIYEITDTPLASLSHAEQVRINDGIPVQGEENLARVLEDYSS